MLGSIHSGLSFVFWLLAVIAFLMEAFSLIDAIRRPAEVFPAAGKQTKQLWLIILGLATAFGFVTALISGDFLGILSIAAFVAAVIYLADVRPAIKTFGRGDGRRMGPYGPW